MKKLREIRTRIDAYIQTHKPAAFIMWLLVLLFPLWLSLSGNAISFLSGEDGAAVLLRTLLTENYGAFLLGMLLIYLFFGAMICLWKQKSSRSIFFLGICCWQKMQTASPHFFLR